MNFNSFKFILNICELNFNINIFKKINRFYFEKVTNYNFNNYTNERISESR